MVANAGMKSSFSANVSLVFVRDMLEDIFCGARFRGEFCLDVCNTIV